MILSTTPTLEGKTIREYRGIVVGEAILGANIFKDLFAGIRDIIGGRSGAYEKELARAREIALAWAEELEQRYDMACTLLEGEEADTLHAVGRTGIAPDRR